MNTFTNTATETYQVTACYKCGIKFGVTTEHYGYLLRDRAWFHCPNGHSQVFLGESETQRLEKQKAVLESQLDAMKCQRDMAKRRIAAMKGVRTKLKQRIAAGVCPCCQRSFENLARHMNTKHPEYLTEEKT